MRSNAAASGEKWSTAPTSMLAVVVLVAIATSTVWWPILTRDARPVNPAIFDAFRYWEGRCLREQWPDQTVRCKALLDRMSCQEAEFGCSAKEWHEFLADVGFDLPPYYQPEASR